MSIIIGFAGGSASGKTSIIKLLQKELGKGIQVISLDSYYKPYSEYSFEERTTFNYDHPDAFDIDRVINDIKLLKEGKSIEMPIYDYVNYTRSKETETIYPNSIIIIEGLLTLYYEKLLPLLDLKIFVCTDADIRLIRRIRRDTVERGRTVESVLNQYLETVKPMHEAFIEPSMKFADIIIPRGMENKKGVDIITRHLKLLISEHKRII